MFRYLEEDQEVSSEKKSRLAEWFLAAYTSIKAADIYRWVWEGEFGNPSSGDLSLDRITEDIRRARIHGRRPNMIWEPLGLALVLVKVNLVPYADGGYPLKRLLTLEERVREVRPNPMRLKHDWALMKTQLVPGMAVTLEDINEFENSIPFHIVPEVPFSDPYMKAYGAGYRIVPRSLFFSYYEEFKMQEQVRLFGEL